MEKDKEKTQTTSEGGSDQWQQQTNRTTQKNYTGKNEGTNKH